MKKVLILMSETGGGHHSAARAIAEAMDRLQPGREIEIIDFIASCALFPFDYVGRLYRPMVSYAPSLWSWFWHLSNDPQRTALFLKLFAPLIGGGLARLFREKKPQAIISVHPFANHLAVRAASEIDVPVITVVTDLVSLHASWLCPEVALCLVPTEQAREKALARGLHSDKVVVTGLPVDLMFAQGAFDKGRLRAKLELRRDLPTILLVGGGEGMGRVFEIATAISRVHFSTQLLVVAGRNGGLKCRLEAANWEIPTRMFGFVSNMPELMHASDIIITKAGPTTICEALACALPIVLSGAVPGQEEGNVDYVVDSGAGRWAPTPEEVVSTLEGLLTPGSNALARMGENARRLARPEAALDIARLIAELC